MIFYYITCLIYNYDNLCKKEKVTKRKNLLALKVYHINVMYHSEKVKIYSSIIEP